MMTLFRKRERVWPLTLPPPRYVYASPERFALLRRSYRFDVGGVVWYRAPLPPEKHECFAQTVGVVDYLTDVDRCSCGAIRINAGEWSERNARKNRGGR